ncbi:hypothetical protein [Taibaiella koreensis]|uniref:hypothetical protein n=1 Tax=Taibaiella koreensis TaxID=1268548 RepID=UPI0013C3292B|nr:hypothetical protein [Taibaiella koreensis]
MLRLLTLLLLCSLLTLSALSASAKKQIFWTITPTDTLSGNISFGSVRVIDQREDKSNLGTVLGWGKKGVLTADSLPVALKHMITTMLRTAQPKAEQELLVVVKAITLTDFIKTVRTVGSVYLRIDWYLGQQDRYALALQTDSLYEFPAPSPIDLLADFFLTESVKEAAALAPPAAYTLRLPELLATEEQVRAQQPIYKAAPGKGIYYTQEQFRSNSPQSADFIYKHYTGSLYLDEFYLKNEKGKRGRNLADTAYAIYNGEKWFRPYTETDFKEMKRAGNDFYYYAIQKGIHIEDYSAVAGAGASGGILGTLISTAAAKAMQDRQYRKPIPMADALYRMRIDPVTGKGKRVERLQ